ncbi:hypothetical protein [Rhodococcus qingshengii]|uniref:hypothetical protein n=1 Tax=Rhodococcus qingshengii TaxID=334542 RepID=UPI0009F18693|nr:hypothetical protein [Rhodococcus qingshengii]ORC17795.1 hypothetical protein BXO91_27310 [Rhodococcus qingshengii]
MPWDWSAVNQVLDDVVILAGIGWMIVRQFIWRSTDLSRMLRLPALILAAGLIYVVFEFWGDFRWMVADWIIVGEFLLVAVTGTVMGHVTRFRSVENRLQFKLNSAGLWLWVIFVGIRVGSFYLAAALGASLAGTTGLVLLSFGINRLAAIVVVRRRARDLSGGAVQVAESSPRGTRTHHSRL